MKTPTARKLPSGSWFVRVMVDGVSTDITRATKKEAEQEAMAIKSKAKAIQLCTGKTLKESIDDYVNARKDVLSPTTVRGYHKIRDLRFQSLMGRRISDITQSQWQRAVNEEAKSVSAKTLKNAWGFISSVITESTGRKVTVRLPQIVANEAAYLSSTDLKKFLDKLRGDPYEIPVLLGLSGLRRSEIMAVTWSDIDLTDGCIYVRGSAVLDEDNNLVQRKENKNTSSRRRVPFLIPQLRKAVEEIPQEFRTAHAAEPVAHCYPNTINLTTQRICKAAGIPKCTCHGLRKSFASMMLVDLHQPEAVVMQAGGWSDPGTMRKIYTQVSTENLDKAGEAFEQLFKSL